MHDFSLHHRVITYVQLKHGHGKSYDELKLGFKDISGESTNNIKDKMKENKEWQNALPEGIDSLASQENCDKLINALETAMVRAFRRRPTRRSEIYDLFIVFYIDRGT